MSKDKTIVKFYRGTHSMGIVISVTYNNDRVIFDFGAPFTPLTEVYDGVVMPRIKNRVKDAILLGKIPPVEGVFSRKDIESLPVIPYEDVTLNTAILICHLHLDHMSEIDKVNPNIPVYIGKDGLKLLNVLEEMEEENHYRDYSSFDYGDEIVVGEIKVKTFFNNHPCPGTTSFLIQTPNQNIVYTGDIRFHGLKCQEAWDSIDEIAKNHIDLLIIDSTTTSPSEFVYNESLLLEYKKTSRDFLKGEIKESDMYDQIYNELNDFDGVGIFNQYKRDVDMLESMYLLGKKLHRNTVYEPSYAYILYKLKGIIPTVCFPDTNEEYKYYEELLKVCEVVTIHDIKNNPSKYLFQNSYKYILSLVDLEGVKGKYYHLLGEPLVKESKEWNIMLNFINKLHFSFVTFINLYSFSHAYPNHLAEAIKTINATTVVAVHSKHPENLNPVNSIQVIPKENVNYLLEKGILKEM